MTLFSSRIFISAAIFAWISEIAHASDDTSHKEISPEARWRKLADINKLLYDEHPCLYVSGGKVLKNVDFTGIYTFCQWYGLAIKYERHDGYTLQVMIPKRTPYGIPYTEADLTTGNSCKWVIGSKDYGIRYSLIQQEPMVPSKVRKWEKDETQSFRRSTRLYNDAPRETPAGVGVFPITSVMVKLAIARSKSNMTKPVKEKCSTPCSQILDASLAAADHHGSNAPELSITIAAFAGHFVPKWLEDLGKAKLMELLPQVEAGEARWKWRWEKMEKKSSDHVQ